jgi:hypothetical protein
MNIYGPEQVTQYKGEFTILSKYDIPYYNKMIQPLFSYCRFLLTSNMTLYEGHGS